MKRIALFMLFVAFSAAVAHAQTFVAVLTQGGVTGTKEPVMATATFTLDDTLDQLRFSVFFRPDLFNAGTVAIFYGTPKNPGPRLFILAGNATYSPLEGAAYDYNLELRPELGIYTLMTPSTPCTPTERS